MPCACCSPSYRSRWCGFSPCARGRAGRTTRPDEAQVEHVIVLHGLAVNRGWMAGIARFLRREGYGTHDISYPSRAMTLDGLVDAHIAPLVERVPAQKAHFVAHSMGGLLVRLYARKY